MLETGMKLCQSITVTPEMTAQSMKSGALDVFATPLMICFMENCCMELAAPHLEAGKSTVGTLVNVSHLAATPVGMKVEIEATLTQIDRRRLVFEVKATDERELIGQGIHERFIVDEDKFTAKCEAKRDAHAQ